MHYLPSYSPEHNSDERLNRSLKNTLRHLPEATDERSLKMQIIGRLCLCQKQPERVRSFFNSSSTTYCRLMFLLCTGLTRNPKLEAPDRLEHFLLHASRCLWAASKKMRPLRTGRH